MHVLHVAESLDGASGVVTFVRALDANLNAQGIESRVTTSGCFEGCGRVDVVHIHGLWLNVFHRAAQWALANGVPIVWSTHGMTAPWAMRHKRWKKFPAWWLYQRKDLKRAAAIHCTTTLEEEWNKALGLNNCFVAPLGTDERINAGERAASSEKTLLFVGRIYPVKGLANLIKAWGRIKEDTNRGAIWRLRIVGPDQAGHLTELKALVAKLGLFDSIIFAGPKFGVDLSREYDNCDCLVLPSFTENFGATIVDALAHGKPCIASTFTPWKELVEHGCGWWVPNDPSSLATAMEHMMTLDDIARREMGKLGCRLVMAKYSWDAVTKRLIQEYERLLVSRKNLKKNFAHFAS